MSSVDKPGSVKAKVVPQLRSDDAVSVAELTAEVSRLTAELSYREIYIADLETMHAQQLRVRAETEARAIADALMLRTSLNAFHASSSWRLTRPFRAAARTIRKTIERIRNIKRTDRPTGEGMRIGVDPMATISVASIDANPEAMIAWIKLLSKRAAKGN